MVSQSQNGAAQIGGTLKDSVSAGSEWVGIVAAYPWEVGPFIRSLNRLPPQELIEEYKSISGNGSLPTASNSCDVFLRGVAGRRFVLAIGGQGEARAGRAAKRLVDSYPVKGLVSMGFAGGLALGLKAGEAIMATEVFAPMTQERYPCASSFLDAGNMRSGRLICSSEVIAKAQEKQDLGQRWDAIAVDMESVGVAKAAQGAGIPFCAVKAISDSAEESLSIDFSRCQREDNELSLWAVLLQGLSSPSRVRELCRLGWDSRKAAIALAKALGSK